MTAAAMIFGPAYPAPNRRHFAVLALLLAAFAVYGSIAPLHLQRLPFAEAIARFRAVLAQPLVMQSRSDWLANFLLLLPLGFSLMATLCCDRPNWTLPALPVVLAACVALAVFVEFAQLFFPPRVSSVNDIAAQALGSVTGILFWLLRGQHLTANARLLWRDFGSKNTAHLLLPFYVFVVLIVQTLPFDFTLSPVELYHKYKECRIHLLPFAASGVMGFELANKVFWNAALYAPVGFMLAHLPGRVGRNGARVLVLGLTVASVIELAQLLAFSRSFDSIDILTGGTAVLAAWLFVRRFPRPLDKPELRRILLAGCLAALVFMEWQPFRFSLSLSEARSRLHQVSLLPFVDYLQGNYINSLDDGIHKILLFVPLGVLLAPCRPASREKLLLCWSLAVIAAVVLEMGQLFLPVRYPSGSDVLVDSAAAGIGLLFAYRRVYPPLPRTVTSSLRPAAKLSSHHGYRISL